MPRSKIKDFINDSEVIKSFERELDELLSIPSVATGGQGEYPYGGECARALDKALEIAGKYGLKTQNHGYRCGSAVYGGGGTEVGIITHLDVVPAGEGWSYNPYSLTIDREKGLYIGRGSGDDKGPLLMSVYALRFLWENNITLPFAVRLIFGSDEEVGSTDLEYYKTKFSPPAFSFTPDAGYPVCVGEKGIMHLKVCLGRADESLEKLSAGSVTNAVAGQAAAVSGGVETKVYGVTAHASMPEPGVNAIYLLAEKMLSEGSVPESNKKAFEFLKQAGSEYLGRTLGIDFADKNFGYLTCVAGVLGISGGMIHLDFDIRFPVSKTYGEVYSAAKRTIEDLGFSIVKDNSSSPIKDGYFKSPDTKEIKALTRACEEVLGGDCEPYTMGGGTYARSMPNAVAFGARIEGYEGILGKGRGKAHDRDEYIAIDEVKKGIEIFIKSLLYLAEGF